jgi:hypothetical protein
MIRQQARIHLDQKQDILNSIEQLLSDYQKLGARRNEIAHERVYNMGEYGYSLGPSTVKNSNFPEGFAKFQYASEDILHYCAMLASCRSRLHEVMRGLKREYNSDVVLCQFQDP